MLTQEYFFPILLHREQPKLMFIQLDNIYWTADLFFRDFTGGPIVKIAYNDEYKDLS